MSLARIQSGYRTCSTALFGLALLVGHPKGVQHSSSGFLKTMEDASHRANVDNDSTKESYSLQTGVSLSSNPCRDVPKQRPEITWKFECAPSVPKASFSCTGKTKDILSPRSVLSCLVMSILPLFLSTVGFDSFVSFYSRLHVSVPHVACSFSHLTWQPLNFSSSTIKFPTRKTFHEYSVPPHVSMRRGLPIPLRERQRLDSRFRNVNKRRVMSQESSHGQKRNRSYRSR